jgi:threonine/homoserine/homoserine lactone efflux protein
MLAALVIGFCFGFFGSIPVAGPIAAIVLKRGLTGRFASAAFVGIGGGIAEALYAFLAFWGYATWLADKPWVEPISRSVAAIILIALGISFARYRSKEGGTVTKVDESMPKSLLLGFTITALNPTLIVTWTAATTTLAASDIVTLEPIDAIPFSLGALAGIVGWFAMLTVLLRRYGPRFDKHKLDLFVRGVGVLILGLGLWFGIKAVMYFAAGS